MSPRLFLLGALAARLPAVMIDEIQVYSRWVKYPGACSGLDGGGAISPAFGENCGACLAGLIVLPPVLQCPGACPGDLYYADFGKLGRALPAAAQDHTLYAAFDVDLHPWVFNCGIGRGLTDAADRWTAKFIFEVPW